MLQKFYATTFVVELLFVRGGIAIVTFVSITAIANCRASSQLYRSTVQLANRTAFCASVLYFFAGLSQCYTVANCTGEEVAAADQRDCCVGTNDGLSYNDGSTCNRCIGMLVKMYSN